ncbi:MAG: type IV secretion system DNA-binding domain-containing protein [Burkholderiales bacterium]
MQTVLLHRDTWQSWLHGFGNRAWQLQAREFAPMLPAVAAAVAAYIKTNTAILRTHPENGIRHVRGRRLFFGDIAQGEFDRESKAEVKISGEGIRLHPSMPSISLDRETRHFLVVGSVGGGKTQVIKPIMQAAIGRGDKMIIYDNKGDFTSEINGYVVCPWDRRSLVWDVASDVVDKQDARTFSARMIPESKDPLWANAARQVMVGLIIKLQSEKPGIWSFSDLASLVAQPKESLVEILSRYFPEGLRAVSSGKTTDSILINLSAFCSVVFDLAEFWSDSSVQKISFRAWLAYDEPMRNKRARILILQGSGRFAELQKAYIGAILGVVSGQVNSPDFAESKTRKIWLCLDEFAQLGKVPNFAPLIEVGRSKGVRVVIGTQDISQIIDLYGKDTSSSLVSMIGTHIYCRILPGDTAETVSRAIGQREVERWNQNQQQGGGSWSPAIMPTIMPSELSNRLGPSKSGISALFIGYRDALILNWNYTSIPKIRESTIMKQGGVAPAAAGNPDAAGSTTIASPLPPRALTSRVLPAAKRAESVQTPVAPTVVPDPVLLSVADPQWDDVPAAQEDGESAALDSAIVDLAVPGAGLLIDTVSEIIGSAPPAPKLRLNLKRQKEQEQE